MSACYTEATAERGGRHHRGHYNEVYMETLVAVARAAAAGYGRLREPMAAPELPEGAMGTIAGGALRDLFETWGLDAERRGLAEWNPLGALAPEGSRILIKPNWVTHRNESGAGLDCLVTHATVIEALLHYVTLTKPAAVILGDAPIMGCEFETLLRACGIHDVVTRFRSEGLPLEVRDFRRTVLHGSKLGNARSEGLRGSADYVLFDLKEQSLLEAISGDARKFRVTMYNPDLLARTHAAGRHQYLVAREVMDADVVINLPKLKSHKKSCITGALKNVVGINGNKEYLPHHRKGGSASGGDCYAGGWWLKRGAEGLLDAANRRSAGAAQRLLGRWAQVMNNCAARLGADDNLEGSWYGNDTIWRTSLDLQTILHYGRADGQLDERPQRRVIHITDALTGGEGNGPLANTAVDSRFLTGAVNAAAAEWIHARLMGFDPERIPLVREAFGRRRYPLARFEPAAIRMRCGGREYAPDAVFPFEQRGFRPASGWEGHCELTQTDDERTGRQDLVGQVPGA
jgi:uncharacterized protein (DUF362 family)